MRHTWKNGELSAYTFAPLFPENGEADEEAAAFAKKLNEEKPLYVVREDVKACLKTFGEQAIAIWKSGSDIWHFAAETRLWKQKCWRNRISFLHLPLI